VTLRPKEFGVALRAGCRERRPPIRPTRPAPPAIVSPGVLTSPMDAYAVTLVPALIADAGDAAGWRYVEFFNANIRNPNTRRAYARAAAARGGTEAPILTAEQKRRRIERLKKCIRDLQTMSERSRPAGAASSTRRGVVWHDGGEVLIHERT
jgi:hypothetical protein